MPLIRGKSKKAFSKNVEAEMHAGKPQKQSLAIAFSVKRKAPKKMAQGGKVPPSAKLESRPSADEQDMSELSRNRGDKPAREDNWTDQPTVKQAQKPSITRLSQPRIVGSDAFSVRRREDVEQDKDAMDSMAPSSPKDQPQARDNEEEATKHGDEVPALHMKRMAEGGKINDRVSMRDAEMDEVEHPEGLESDDDDMSPSEDEIMSNHMQALARGGEVSPEPEEEMEHHDSIAAAIMARRDRLHQMIDSGSMDEDHAAADHMASGGSVESGSRDMNYADGGEINGMDSIYAHPDEDQADLRRNAEEDANMEDQSSYDALRKENYSESEGLDELDSPRDSAQKGDSREEDEENKHDMISSIRNKMNTRRQFKTR